MTVRDLFVALARRWRGAAAILLLVVAGAAVATATTPKVYESRTTIYFAAADGSGQSTGNLYQMPDGEKTTLARIARSPLVLDPVRATLGYEASVPVSVEALPSGGDASLFDFVVRSDSPEHARAFAEAVPEELARTARTYAPTLAQSGDAVEAQYVDQPTASSDPVEPNPVQNLLISGLAGLFLAVAYALGMHAFDTRLRTSEDLRGVSDKPVLSAIPVLGSKGSQAPLYLVDDPFGPQAEAVRKLRTNLVFVDVAADSGHSFVVTSALSAEGKTTTVLNLGMALAESGRTVLVLDADLRHPSVARELGLEGAVGLTSVLAGEAGPEDVIQRYGDTEMFVLSGGVIPPNPSELLGSKAMEKLFHRLVREFDFVLVDSPPVLPVTDALVMSRLTGGLLLVVSAASTRKRHVQEALRTLETGDVDVDGFVLTKTPVEREGYYYYGTTGDARRAQGPRGESRPLRTAARERSRKLARM
ncbi:MULTISPECIES: polysaccharide biosynthesis tyrosine autokinase [unclassified Ornithinimicrobium]|uniref:polysaccharide biosynthesis tyrosine autokinase n=1 Tax=unclassified Ornithinimicrobium TaxID=2615080 RepID=UPI003854B2F3